MLTEKNIIEILEETSDVIDRSVNKEDFKVVAKAVLSLCENKDKVPPPPEWYTRDNMYSWLINEKYCHEVAEQLCQMFADGLQSSFKKGWEKGYNDYNEEKSTKNYKYYTGIPFNPLDHEQTK